MLKKLNRLKVQQNRYQTQEANLGSQEKRIVKQRAKIKTQEDSFEKQKAKFKTQEDKIDKKRADLKAQENKIDKKRTDLKTQENKIDRINSTPKSQKTNSSTRNLKSKEGRLKGRLTKLKKLENLTNKRTAKLKKKEDRLYSRKPKLQTKKGKIEKLKASLELKQDQVNKQTKKLKTQEGRIERQVKQIGSPGNPFKSQKDQDKWVITTALPSKKNGFFLDLAAADGMILNNTYVLEKQFGWKGICIEPNPTLRKKLQENRNCIIDASVVSNKREKVKFRIDNELLGGIVAEDTDNSYEIRGEQLDQAEIVEFDAVLLNDLLDKHNAPRVIDYFSLDIEGSEERVISSLDFEKYTFQCLTIERPTPKINEILFANQYLFVKNHLYDSFYIHESLPNKGDIELLPFEQIPPKEF